jgi:hypothetical protein
MRRLLPTAWRPDVSRVLPPDPGTYHGPGIALWATVAYLTLITVRSGIHLLSADGGAESIATIDTTVAGGDNIIAVFGQWGATQLLLALLLWVLVLRYRGLLPLVLVVLLVEPFLRALAGQLKPIETMGTAPGAALNWVIVPVIALLLYLALCPADRGSPAVGNG